MYGWMDGLIGGWEGEGRDGWLNGWMPSRVAMTVYLGRFLGSRICRRHMHGVAGELAVVELMVVSVHGAVTIRVVTVPVPGIEATGRQRRRRSKAGQRRRPSWL